MSTKNRGRQGGRVQTRPLPRSLAALVALGLLACGPEHEIVMDCESAPGIRAVCGFQNPEDLALLADGHTLIVSQFGQMDGSRPGNLALYDARGGGLRVAFRGETDVAARPPSRGATIRWGDPSCPGPPSPAFSPHGIHLSTDPDGPLRLLVVNHGGRESVEFFEVVEEPAGPGIHWRGCAIPPDGTYMNDVVNLPDGGFLVTHMMDRGNEAWGLIQSSLGIDTGFVYEWQPGTGFSVVPGTEAPFANGIELSADGRDIYLNAYGSGQVRRISRETGELLAVADVPSPDNLAWARDGRLLVASHLGGMGDQLACYGLTEGACPMAFEIVALDPITLEGGPVFANEGAPMGAGTVAVEVGDELVIGSFAGDRVIHVPLAP
jgi:hypothetical protein